MILLEYLRDNEITLTKRGHSAMRKAFQDVYPNLKLMDADDRTVNRFMVYDLPDEDCLKILQLTAKYAGLWAFA